ncbi:Helix-turn-helix domain-containing protein [Candidatus Hepatincolaceae symbiont of Richtersius coronifer]
MDLIEIKYLVAKKGLTFVEIDRMNGLREGSICLIIAKPHKAGEKALSEALEIPAYRLFPERYDIEGKRYAPQPRGNYNYKNNDDRKFTKNTKLSIKNTVTI